MGLLLIFARHPSPRVLDRADDRLPARMHVDVLDRDLLLALTSVTVQAFQKGCERS